MAWAAQLMRTFGVVLSRVNEWGLDGRRSSGLAAVDGSDWV
jgi:hypothetical protein